MANLLLSVMGAFAEFERALIGERQREGIALTKQRGAYRGRNRHGLTVPTTRSRKLLSILTGPSTDGNWLYGFSPPIVF